MRKFLLAGTAAAAAALALGPGSALAQQYAVASPYGLEATGPEVDVIDTTTADPRVTPAMVEPYLPELGGGRPQWEMANVVGDTAPHPAFIDIEAIAEPVPQTAAVVEPQAPDPESLQDTIYFDFDEATLTPRAQAKIDELATVMDAWNLEEVEVAGHTDRAGPADYNVALSESRSETVAEALRAKGLTPRILEQEWYGERRPAVPTADGVRLQANRRVEVQAVE